MKNNYTESNLEQDRLKAAAAQSMMVKARALGAMASVADTIEGTQYNAYTIYQEMQAEKDEEIKKSKLVKQNPNQEKGSI